MSSGSTIWFPIICNRPLSTLLPASQRQLMTLILRKLLASSTYAISDTLEKVCQPAATRGERRRASTGPARRVADNFEGLPEIEDEWSGDGDESETAAATAQQFSPTSC